MNEHPYMYEPPAQPEKKKKRGARMVALALCCALLGGAAGAGITLLTQREEPVISADTSIFVSQRQPIEVELVALPAGKELTAAEVYAANVNSTVGITTAITTNYWGFQTTVPASGSGFILTEDGYVLTNFHVIEGASSITVTLYDGTAYDAKLVGFDRSRDIAVLKVETQGLTPVVLGSSDNMRVGEPVVAIGNPLGELTFSLTTGVVSALDRTVTLSEVGTMELIQTDCAINSGNSGGALFNLYGEVIGITNAKYSGDTGSGAYIDNIAFAIPVDSVRSIITDIMETGQISKPYIGVTVGNVGTELRRFGYPAGALVQSVAEDSPAAKAGLQINDIITAANGAAIGSFSDLTSLVAGCKPGEALELRVYRKGETLQLSATVGEQLQSALEDVSQSSQQQSQYPFFPW